jgi:hypothetical protein
MSRPHCPCAALGAFLQPDTTRGICLAYFSFSVTIVHVMEVRGLWAMTHNKPIRHVFKYSTKLTVGFFPRVGSDGFDCASE